MEEILKNEEVKEEIVKEESYLYRIIETKDSMENSVENAKEVLRQQRKLIDVLEKLEDDEFKEFIQGMKMQTINLENQINTLNFKLDNVKKVIEICENEDNICEEVINCLIKGFSIFE